VNPPNGADVPEGVVTVKVRVPMVAAESIPIVTGKLVAVPPVPIVAVTPDPVNVTALAPARLLPEMVAPKEVPRAPVVGLIALTIGNVLLVIVKPVKGSEVPAGVTTLTVRVPVEGVLILIVTGNVEAVPPVPIVAVTPVPLKKTAVAPDKLVPDMVALTTVPELPVDGLMPVITGRTEGSVTIPAPKTLSGPGIPKSLALVSSNDRTVAAFRVRFCDHINAAAPAACGVAAEVPKNSGYVKDEVPSGPEMSGLRRPVEVGP